MVPVGREFGREFSQDEAQELGKGVMTFVRLVLQPPPGKPGLPLRRRLLLGVKELLGGLPAFCPPAALFGVRFGTGRGR